MTKNIVDIRPFNGYIIRVGGKNWEFGLPYELCFVAIDLGNGVCEIQGIDKPVTISQIKAIMRELAKIGFLYMQYERKRDNKPIKLKSLKVKCINNEGDES